MRRAAMEKVSNLRSADQCTQYNVKSDSKPISLPIHNFKEFEASFRNRYAVLVLPSPL